MKSFCLIIGVTIVAHNEWKQYVALPECRDDMHSFGLAFDCSTSKTHHCCGRLTHSPSLTFMSLPVNTLETALLMQDIQYVDLITLTFDLTTG